MCRGAECRDRAPDLVTFAYRQMAKKLLLLRFNCTNVHQMKIIDFAPGGNQQYSLYDSKVSAGFPSPAADHVESRLSTDEYLVSNPTATYFVRVQGTSMIDAGIFEGDVLVVDRSVIPAVGMIVLAEIEGEFTVKTLGHNQLIPANPAFKPIKFKEGSDVTIVGVVTGSMRKFMK